MRQLLVTCPRDTIPCGAAIKSGYEHKILSTGGRVLSCIPLSVLVDSKDADFVHVRELGNHQDEHCKRVQEKHWILVISCVRSYQVPATQVGNGNHKSSIGKNSCIVCQD